LEIEIFKKAVSGLTKKIHDLKLTDLPEVVFNNSPSIGENAIDSFEQSKNSTQEELDFSLETRTIMIHVASFLLGGDDSFIKSSLLKIEKSSLCKNNSGLNPQNR